jgi:hypothetical protein
MDQLPHAPVCIAVSGSDVVLGEAIDEDGAQRLVLAVVGRGIGIQEELSTRGGIHGCDLECEVVFSDSSSQRRIKVEASGQAGWHSGPADREKPIAPTDRTTE